MDGLFPILLVFAVMGGVLLVVSGIVDLRNYLFVIKIVEGRAVVSRGKVVATFVDEVAEVCAEYSVTSGWVGGVRSGRRNVRLVFSRSIPKPCQQRLRNIWRIRL